MSYHQIFNENTSREWSRWTCRSPSTRSGKKHSHSNSYYSNSQPKSSKSSPHTSPKDTYFYVSSKGQNPTLRPARAGVPQGSAVGPVFFILYINDIPTSQNHRVINSIYADDTVIFATSRSPQIVNHLLQIQTEKIIQYFQT